VGEPLQGVEGPSVATEAMEATEVTDVVRPVLMTAGKCARLPVSPLAG